MEEEKDGLENGKREKRDYGRENAYYSARPKFGAKGPSKLRQQFGRGITIFLVVAASILFYFALLRLTNLSAMVSKVIDVLKPVIYGCAIAYLLNPIVKKVDKYLLPVLERNMKKKESAKSISRGAGVLTAVLVLICLIVALCNLLIPELYYVSAI